MANKKEGAESNVKSLERRVKKLEQSSVDYRHIGKKLLIVGIVIFSLSFILDDSFFGLFRFMSFGNIGFILFVVGLVMLLASPKGEALKKAKPIKLKEKKEIEDKPEVEEKPIKKRTKKEETYAFKLPSYSSFYQKYMPKKQKEDLETNIGTKWFTRIGIVSLVIGLIFFLKYAFDKDLIPPTWRILIGVAVSIALIVLGEYFDKKGYILYARALTGGGFAVLYASIFAAHNFYDLISLFFDLIVLIVVVLLAIFFAVKYDSVFVASLAFILGYITAYLTGNSNIHTLGYTALLTSGLLVLVYKKGWKYLGLGGLAATYIIHMVWLDSHRNSHLTHLIFLTIYLILFGIMSLRLKQYIRFKRTEEMTLATKILIAAVFLISFAFTFVLGPVNFYYLLFYLLLTLGIFFIIFRNNWGEMAVGGSLATYISFIVWHNYNSKDPNVLLYSAIFLTIYFLLYTMLSFYLSRENKKFAITGNIIMILINSFFYFGLAFKELEKNFDNLTGLFTLGISVFYLALTYISSTKKIKSLFITYLVLTTVYLTLTIPIQLNKQWITISWAIEALLLVLLGIRFNNITLRILAYIVGGIATIKTAFIDGFSLQAFDMHNLIGSTRIYVFFVSIIVFYICAVQLFKNKHLLNVKEIFSPAFFGIAATALTAWILYLEGKDWTSLWWAIQAFILLIIGFRLGNKEIRYAANVIGVITVLKLIFMDSALREFQLSDFGGSIRAFVYLFAIITFYICARIYEKPKVSLDKKEARYGIIAYDSAATILTTILLGLEFEKELMSVTWALQAIVLLVIGFGFKKKLFRQLGIGIFALTIGKVFIIDFQELEIFFRIISFLVLGIILLIAAFIYHKYKDRIKGII